MDTIPELCKIPRRVGNWAAVAVSFRRRGLCPDLSRSQALIIVTVGMFFLSSQLVAEDRAQTRVLLEQFLHEITTFQAKFEQQLFDEYGDLLETANGEVTISKPGKFRWEYQQPYSQLIVTDGTTLWVYDVDLEQVSINPFSHGAAGSPAELLVGEVDLDQHYVIAESSGEDGIAWISLTPRNQDAQYHAIEIGFNGNVIHAMKLRDNLNQLTDIRFSDIERNDDVGDERFRFVPPPGVDVMQGPGN